MNKKIVFLYDLRHPLHEKFLRTTGCDFVHFSKNPPKGYDIYIIEGTYIKPLLLKKIGKFDGKSKIVTLFSDPRLFYLKKGILFDFKEKKIRRYPLLRGLMARKMLKELDGAICIGNFIESLFRDFNKKSPALNIPAFVFRENTKKLEKIKPDLSSHDILFIGHGPDHYVKGIDLMIDVFKRVKIKFPDANLYILGKWDVKKEWKNESIHFEGIQNIAPYLKKCSLSIHLGRGESFGINILETMLAGIPTIVSEYTGAKQAVIKADKNLITSLDKEEIVNKIEGYFNQSLNKKETLSKKCRKAAEIFNEKDMLNQFRRNFPKFIEAIK